MALVDYAALDESEYYGQDFERDGVVSLWVGVASLNSAPRNLDILQDYCGIGYYSLDMNEVVSHAEPRTIAELVGTMSYAESFAAEADTAARRLGAPVARWAVAQFDFAYDPSRVRRSVRPEAIFLGVFGYSVEDAQQ